MRAHAKAPSAGSTTVGDEGLGHLRRFARLALLALATCVLLALVVPTSVFAAGYAVGPPLSVPGQGVSSVAVNQASRDVYVGRFGFALPPSENGDMHRFSSAGVDLGCTLTLNPSGSPARPASVAVNPDGSLRVIDIATLTTTKLRKFPAACGAEENPLGGSEVHTSTSSEPVPQPAVDSSGNLYVPNPADNQLQKFDSTGAQITTGGFPISGLTKPSAAAVDGAGNIYVLQARGGLIAEKQTITFAGANNGDTFTLNFNGAETAPITYSTTAATRNANVKAALEALPQVGAKNAGASGSGTTVATFQGGLGGVDVPLMSCAHSFTGASPSCTVATTITPSAPAAGSLVKFAPDGSSLGTVLTGDFSSFARDASTGSLFLGTGFGTTSTLPGSTGFHIQKFSAGGVLLADFGAGQFKTPIIGSTNLAIFVALNQLAVDETSGTVYAADPGNSKVQVFNVVPQFALSIDTASGSGAGTVECDTGSGPGACLSSYDQGTVVTITQTPTPPATFTKWEGCDSIVAGACKVTMSAAKSVKAVFDISRTLTVTATGKGKVDASSGAILGCRSSGGVCTGPYNQASTVTLTATPDAHQKFTGWGGADVGACDQTGATLTCPVTIPAHNAAISAGFAPIIRTVTVTVSGNGNVSASSGAIASCTSSGGTCAGTYDEDSTVTLTATPDAHQKFTGWGGADVGACDQTGATLTCPMTVPTHNAAITATFAVLPNHALTIGKAGSGSGAVTCNGGPCAAGYEEGTTITLSASPAAGSSFAGWSGGGCSGAGNCVITIKAPTTATATFDLIPSTGGGGGGTGGGGTGGGTGDNGSDQAACVKAANAAFKKAMKAAKKKHGKAKARAVKAAKKKKAKALAACKG